jgi:magnesium transporter
MPHQDTLKHQRDLNATLEEIVRLIGRQDVVADLVGREATPKTRQEVVQSLLQRQQSAELSRRMDRMHPADLAYVLENVPFDKRQMIWNLIPNPRRGAVLLELADAVRESLIGGMKQDEVVDVAAYLNASQIAELMPKLSRELALDVLNALDRQNRKEVQEALSFPRDSVGALMEFDMLSVREDMTVDDVLGYLRRQEHLPENVGQLFVVSHDGVLQGVLRLRDLIRNAPELPIRGIMQRDPVAFFTDDSARDAAGAFERYDLISAPVLNLHNQLVGVVRIDRVVDFKDELAQRERLHQVGLAEDEDAFGPVWASARNRWIWLGLNLTTAFIASRVIGAFEDTIAQLVALAALMPIVASIGGNTGNQTVALMIRGIALREINRGNVRHFLFKEIGVCLVNGVVWGTVIGLAAYLLYFDPGLSAVMIVATAGNLMIAALAGVFIPATLHYFGRDPVMGSSVLLTAVTDAMGFFMFLGTATLVLI